MQLTIMPFTEHILIRYIERLTPHSGTLRQLPLSLAELFSSLLLRTQNITPLRILTQTELLQKLHRLLPGTDKALQILPQVTITQLPAGHDVTIHHIRKPTRRIHPIILSRIIGSILQHTPRLVHFMLVHRLRLHPRLQHSLTRIYLRSHHTIITPHKRPVCVLIPRLRLRPDNRVRDIRIFPIKRPPVLSR